MTDKVQKIREEVVKLKSNLMYGACSSQIAMETCCKEEAYNEVLAILDTIQEEQKEPSKFDAAIQEGDDVRYNEDLGCRVNLSQLKRVAKKEEPVNEDLEDVAKEHFWKPADGEDLPEIDKEVIALTQPYSNDEHLRVVFAHRPNKYTTWIEKFGEKKIVEVERYGKGEWNIPNVKWWLDVALPKEIEL